MRSSLKVINFIGATILTALLSVSTAVGQTSPGAGTTVFPHALTFPRQIVGTRSAAKTITVTNATPHIQPISVATSTSAPFQSVGCSNVLGPFKSCTINVTFAPVVVGPKNGNITVHAAHAPFSTVVTLSGIGVASMAETVVPDTLTFPPQIVGTRSDAMTIRVTNAAPFALPIRVATSAPFQSVGCVGRLLSHKSCTIKVTFAPVVVGPANAVIVVNDGTTIGTVVTLSGTGVASTFNGDSKPDLVWQNQSDGQIGVWFMNGSNRISATNFSPGQITDTAWKIVGIADFNADSKPDLVWQNQSNGQIGVWFMDGSNLMSATNFSPGQVSDTNWKIVGTGDFNSDSKPDLVWQNQSNGQIGVWFMDGTNLINATNFSPGRVDTAWKIVGTGDFNSDSKPDLVWQDQSNGHVWVWFMNGINLINAANFSPGQVSDTTWKIVGTGDFNSDSKPDLVWQNQSDGQIGVWFMDGINLIDGTNFSPGQVSDLNWKIPNVWALQ